MDALAVKTQLEAEGLTLSAVAGGLKVEPASAISDQSRALIRGNRDALLALVTSAFATSTRSREDAIRGELSRIMGEDHRDYPEALALALVFPGALETLLATSADRGRA